MKIRKLVLKGYIRLLYAGIAEIEYTPESEYQLVIGTNGSGKSSLFAELSPNPAARQDFQLGGYKYIEIEHNDSLYCLTSDFKQGGKHTFICDGQVLNDAGGITTQKELVLEHFNYTTELHQLLTGELRLSRMNPQQRREWISRACQYDVTYALRLFNQAKAAARDAVGARKHTETRLEVEYKGLYTDEELTALRKELDVRSEQITELMLAVDNSAMEPEQATRQLEDSLNILKALSHEDILIGDASILQNQPELSTLQREAIQLEQSIRNIEQQLSERRLEYMELEDTLQQLTTVSGAGSLADEKETLKQKLGATYGLRVEFDYGEIDFIQTYTLAEQLETVITDSLLSLPPNVGKRYNKVSLVETQKRHDDILGAKNVKQTELTRQLTRREQLTHAESIECPSCQYVWTPGVAQNDLASTNAKIALLEQQIASLAADYRTTVEFLDEINTWRTLYLNFRQLVTANPTLNSLWGEFIRYDRLYDEPNGCVQIFSRWKEQLCQLAERQRMERRLDELEVVLRRANELAEGGTTQYLTQRATVLADQISQLTQSLLEMQSSKKQLDAVIQSAQHWNQLTIRHTKALEHASKALYQSLDAEANAYFRQHIRHLQTELAQMSVQLTERSTAKQTVTALEQQRAELILKEADYKRIADELSPTSGLIADQLSICINALIDQCNELIAQVWSYEMTILPCGIDNTDLDYRFPIEIKGRDKHVPDISKGSGAQSTFIDFVFVLVYLGFSDLHGYPLFPDELGATFDPEHRMRIVEFFKRVVESKRTSQIFYISHNPEAHDVLVNADVVVLDSDNVGHVPGANKHFKITYAA